MQPPVWGLSAAAVVIRVNEIDTGCMAFEKERNRPLTGTRDESEGEGEGDDDGESWGEIDAAEVGGGDEELESKDDCCWS